MKKFLPLLLIALALHTSAAVKKVLFIGNSYTYVNDLPNLLLQLSESHGDTITVDSYAPGGYTFQQHSTDATALAKIAQGGWDYVILQEQSQRPSFPPGQVATEVYPYAKTLDSLIHVSSPCAETVFYMTWGRKNGDASNCGGYPILCTYNGMQSRLRESYLEMTVDNNATVAPCGMAWKRIRDTDTTIVLYQADESHPEIAGSYLNACVLYSSIFHKSSLNSSFKSTLPDSIANKLQAASDFVVFDSLSQWQGSGGLVYADFSASQSGGLINFTNQSVNGTSFTWAFGDGNGSTSASTSHTYAQAGTYTVTLTVSNACHSSTASKQVVVTAGNGISPTLADAIKVYPSVTTDKLFVEADLPEAEIELYSLSGQLLLQQKLGNGTTEVKLGSLAPQTLLYVVKASGTKALSGQIQKQ
ncbi:MAG: PKD domain-containing protein [Chitinophagales bacterium]